MINEMVFCCEDMKNNIKEHHIIHYSEIFDEYGINIMEDNCSSVLVEFCPWCGKKLPTSKRERWFAELEKLGFENPLFEENIPDDYKKGNWWKK